MLKIIFISLVTSLILGVIYWNYQSLSKQFAHSLNTVTPSPLTNSMESPVPSTKTSNPISPSNNEVKFIGNITEIKNACWADGVCSIKVNDSWIITENGGERPPNIPQEIRGQLIGISFAEDTQKYIGKKVEVYAKKTDNNSLTIYGNKDYYIKLLE